MELRIEWRALDSTWERCGRRGVFNFVYENSKRSVYIALHVDGIFEDYAIVHRSDYNKITDKQMETIKQLVKIRYGS